MRRRPAASAPLTKRFWRCGASCHLRSRARPGALRLGLLAALSQWRFAQCACVSHCASYFNIMVGFLVMLPAYSVGRLFMSVSLDTLKISPTGCAGIFYGPDVWLLCAFKRICPGAPMTSFQALASVTLAGDQLDLLCVMPMARGEAGGGVSVATRGPEPSPTWCGAQRCGAPELGKQRGLARPGRPMPHPAPAAVRAVCH